jgi:hypothetical protein
MQRRRATTATVQGIRSELVARGVTEESVAEAADMTLANLNACLDGATEFKVAEMVTVGGFLRIPLANLFPEAA